MKQWWNWRKQEKELEKEIQHHLGMTEAERMERGASQTDARQAARREFGNVGLVKELARDAWGWRWLAELAEDVRFGLRVLGKNPGFTAVAILTLALGVGVNTTVFTAFNALALKPLPVPNPAKLVRLERWFASGATGDNQYAFSYPEYLNYRDQSRSLEGVIGASWRTPVSATPPTASVGEAPRESMTLTCQLVSANYFSVLGINTLIGQPFAERTKGEALADSVVLSYPFWQHQLNADPKIAGKTLEVNGRAFAILGVTPEDFIGTGNPPQIPDFWAPLETQTQIVSGSDWLHDSQNRSLQLLGRLADGISVGRSQAELNLLTRQFAQANSETDETLALTLHRATYFGATDAPWFRALAAGLMTVVGVILLVACVNLANMLLARAAGREKEIATRRALGASRGRLVRQLLTESVLLALLGGACGLLFSLWATKLEWTELAKLIRSLLGGGLQFAALTPDIPVFLYTFALSLVTGILFGLWPALQSSRTSLTDALKVEGYTGGGTAARSRFRSFLLAAQVAVSIFFLIGAGLLLRALTRSEAMIPGFETRSVFVLSVRLGDDPAKAAILKQQIIATLRDLPEVADIAVADRLPYAGTSSRPFLPETSAEVAKGAPGASLLNYVSPSFFDTVNIPLVRGRTFTPQEAEASLPVAIVSELTARRAWPGEDPIGKRFELDLKFDRHWSAYQVIGVAKDVRFFSLSRIDPAYVYLPANPSQDNRLLFRAAQSSKDTIAAARASLASLDRSLLPALGFESLDDFMHSQQLLPQATALFTVTLALLALSLAAVGIYGVMAYLVAQRTREVGIRLALGASRGDVLRLLLRQGMTPVFAGAACGLAVSTALSSLLRAALAFPANPDLLFGVSAFDPLVYAGLTLLLAGVAVAACAVPASRAMRVDPVVALRYE
jgi:predicted permease